MFHNVSSLPHRHPLENKLEVVTEEVSSVGYLQNREVRKRPCELLLERNLAPSGASQAELSNDQRKGTFRPLARGRIFPLQGKVLQKVKEIMDVFKSLLRPYFQG